MTKKLWHERVDTDAVVKKVNQFVRDLLKDNFVLANLEVTYTRENGQTHFKTKVNGDPIIRSVEAAPDDESIH